MGGSSSFAERWRHVPSITIWRVVLPVDAQTVINIPNFISAVSECGPDNLQIKLKALKTQDLLLQSLIVKQKQRLGLLALVLG